MVTTTTHFGYYQRQEWLLQQIGVVTVWRGGGNQPFIFHLYQYLLPPFKPTII